MLYVSVVCFSLTHPRPPPFPPLSPPHLLPHPPPSPPISVCLTVTPWPAGIRWWGGGGGVDIGSLAHVVVLAAWRAHGNTH